MKRNRLAAYAIGIAVAAAMTGCGGDDDGGGDSDFADQKPADIVDEATKAMGELDSLRMSGEMSSADQEATIDIQLSSAGSCTGSLSFDGTGSIEILGVDGDRWFKGDEAFWSTTGIPDASPVIDKWVVDAEGDFAEFCSVDDFVGGLFEDESDENYESKGVESVDGDDAVAIEQTDADDGVSTGYILVEDPHYMVKIEKEGDEGGSIAFTDFNEEFEVTAPSDDEIVDLSQLG
ncbi:MAG: hypothetical protein M3237_01490 [Actinomycetota bacterium]|nr:hypothetical protein [Actinomycetota bacterium]